VVCFSPEPNGDSKCGVVPAKFKPRLVIIGPLPPPRGGVSVHVERLLHWLCHAGRAFGFVNTKTLMLKDLIKAARFADVAHVHISNSLRRMGVLVILRIFGVCPIITIHGDVGRHGRFRNFVETLTFRLAHAVITLNAHSFAAVGVLHSNVYRMSAFLPPAGNGELSGKAAAVLRDARNNVEILFVTNCSSLDYHSNGKEIYGIRSLLGFFEKIPRWGLVVLDSTSRYRMFSGLTEEMIPTNVWFLENGEDFVPVVGAADAYIRCTQTDGDSLSIWEALVQGKAVFASNVVDRPDGVITFDCNDLQTLYLAIEAWVENPHQVVESALMDDPKKIAGRAIDRLEKIYSSAVS